MTDEPSYPSDDAVEGDARVVVITQPGNALVSRPDVGPGLMIAQATALASALKDVVEKQNLYAVINNKKYPQVEAWMTIGRMDNVVAREAEIIRRDDGSYEAAVELIRLSDGMVIGRGSALCGTEGDRPWTSRPEPVRRSMAVTRATSRAFRQQYSWIMALAGYEPTPADEMPVPDVSPRREDAPPRPLQPAPNGDRRESEAAERRTTHADGLIGKAIAQGTQDFQLRELPDGYSLPFRIKEGRLSQICVATGAIAQALDTYRDLTIGERITVWGYYTDESYNKGDDVITYKVLHVERIKTPAFEMPVAVVEVREGTGGVLPDGTTNHPPVDFDAPPVDTVSTPIWEPLTDDEKAAIAGSLPDA